MREAISRVFRGGQDFFDLKLERSEGQKIPEYLAVPGDGLADVGVPVCQLRVINDQGGRGWDVCTNNSTVRWIEKKVDTEASNTFLKNFQQVKIILHKKKIIIDSTVTLRYIVLVQYTVHLGAGTVLRIRIQDPVIF